jgi:hypothetical protein
MSDDEVRKTVERLQRAADGYGKGEVSLKLENEPRLYRLPKCMKAGLIHHTADKVDLLLDTEGDHRFLIELDSKTAETLYNLLDLTFKSALGRA